MSQKCVIVSDKSSDKIYNRKVERKLAEGYRLLEKDEIIQIGDIVLIDFSSRPGYMGSDKHISAQRSDSG